jgi:MFS family permease
MSSEAEPVDRSSYGTLLRTPSVGWLLTSSIVARLPISMTALAVVLAVTNDGGSYARAGTISAAVIFAEGLTQPLFGRAADRLGRRRVLRVLGVANAIGAVALGFAITGPNAVVFVTAVLTGATAPPVVATMRAAWSGLVSGAARQSAYALEATAQEVLFIIGPMLSALIAALISPRVAVGATGVIGLVGILGMTRTHAVDAREEDDGPRHRGSAIRIGALRRCMLTLGLMILGLACVEIGVIAAVSGGKQATPFAGVVVALWSVGSMLGGFWYGTREEVKLPAAALVALVAGSFALLIAAPNRVVLVVLLTVGGVTVAPMFGRMYAEVSAVTPPSVITEAYGWVSVANLTGAAIGAPLGGYLVGVSSPRLAFAVSASAAALGALVILRLHPRAVTLPAEELEPAVRTGP